MATDDVDNMEGIEMAETEAENPLLTAEEKRVLEVYDRLEELQLEIALLKAQGVLSKNIPAEVTEKDIAAAQQNLLKAKAPYLSRGKIIESTLIASPILNAVHAGSNASVIEQDLFPLIQKRDNLSVTLTELSSKVRSVQDELTKVESENIIIARKNTELAETMLALAEEANTQRKEDIEDPDVRQQLDDLEVAMKASRQKWRIMKGTASATIAGSGVDWAGDPKLLEIVLDHEGDEG